VLAVGTYDRHASPSMDHGGIIRESFPPAQSPYRPGTNASRTHEAVACPPPHLGNRAGVASAFTAACFRYTTLATRLLETLCVCSPLIRIRPHLDGPSPHP
jgi:hypothetical protein